MEKNLLFVAKKPPFIGSNRHLSRIKRRLGVKKAGFSGTLDPFAKGTLLIATGRYTKLFDYLSLSPKRYRATLFLGASSKTLDIEQGISVTPAPRWEIGAIKALFDSLRGELEYTPPSFSAKKIEGVRAYKLARAEREVALKKERMQIYSLQLLNYSHPFLSFEVSLSKGGYVRSLGEIIAKELGGSGVLSFLERISEGRFCYENERLLDPIAYINLPKNRYLGPVSDIEEGKKLSAQMLEKREDGEYLLQYSEFFSIIALEEAEVKYRLNRIPRC